MIFLLEGMQQIKNKILRPDLRSHSSDKQTIYGAHGDSSAYSIAGDCFLPQLLYFSIVAISAPPNQPLSLNNM